MKINVIAPVALIGMALLAGCGKSDNQSKAPSAGTTVPAPATAMPAPTTQVPDTTSSTGN